MFTVFNYHPVIRLWVEESTCWLVESDRWILKVKLYLPKYYRQYRFSNVLCERLAQTDSFAAKERSVAHRVTPLARWSQEVGRRGIESFGNIPLRLTPLLWIHL